MILIYNFLKCFVSVQKKRERKLKLMSHSGFNIIVHGSVTTTILLFHLSIESQNCLSWKGP